MKWTNFSIKAGVVALIALLGWMELGHFQVARLTAQVSELEQEKLRLIGFAKRLTSSRRVAQLDVVKQVTDARGRTVTILLWQEIGADGSLGRPLGLEAVGTQVYVEGMVLKFNPALLEQGEDGRGASVVLFRRIFGDLQTPGSAMEIDRSAGPPLPSTSSVQFDTQLWQRFWDLADSPQLAKQYGVRVAQCEAPSVRVKTGQVWEVSLDTAGGLNLRKIGERSNGITTPGQP